MPGPRDDSRIPGPEPTSTALLSALAAEDDPAVWTEFDQRYRPVLYRLALQLGLGETDAADAAQETLVAFLSSYRAGGYDRERGRLRTWIQGILRNRVRRILRARTPLADARGITAAERLPARSEMDDLWERELRRQVVQDAFDLLERASGLDARTIEAFRLVTLEGRAAGDVARELELTPQAVYMAKHHCTRRLRELVQDLQRRYDVL